MIPAALPRRGIRCTGLQLTTLGFGAAPSPADRVVSSKVGPLLVPRTPPVARDDELVDMPGDLTRRRV